MAKFPTPKVNNQLKKILNVTSKIIVLKLAGKDYTLNSECCLH